MRKVLCTACFFFFFFFFFFCTDMFNLHCAMFMSTIQRDVMTGVHFRSLSAGDSKNLKAVQAVILMFQLGHTYKNENLRFSTRLYTAILTKNATTIQAKYHLSEHTHL
jgi:hypothetical protein